MPDRVPDDFLSRLADGDPFLGPTVAETRAMARELLAMRARVAQLRALLDAPPCRAHDAA